MNLKLKKTKSVKYSRKTITSLEKKIEEYKKDNEVTENVHARNQIITEVNELLRILPLKNWNRFIYLSYEKRILVM